ncbi:MAG TPA: lipopolysaccharide assembly protein LapA domain-containing protein [Stellaceae bacterium]|nr:lipopolysaccharide assembly protein LapA domain-containing protein [Stellaceae bacterium]
MRLIHWVVTLPVAVVAVLFAVSNRDGVSVTLWPFPVRLDAPLYLVVLLALLLGFLVGELVAWINAGRARRLARERARRIEALERELAATQARLPASPPVRVDAGR